MSVKSKFTAIADEIRTLTDSVNSMDLDDILSTLNEAKTEVANQTDLILQIIEEFDYKTMDLEEKFIMARNFKTYENNEFEIIGDGAFTCCTNLTSISFPNCTTIGNGAFASCTGLTSVSFSNCTNIGSNAFYSCTNLTSVNFPKCSTIGNSVFYSCYNLSQVYLTGSSLCQLYNSGAFYSTPFTGYSSYFSGTPCIYVPESLVTSYQNATNWTYFSSYINAY